MSRCILLSHPLDSSTPHYAGSGRGMDIVPLKSIKHGDTANTQEWRLINHLGTHVDAPRHFFDMGKPIDEFDAAFWVCRKAAVVEMPLAQGRLLEPSDIPHALDKSVECLFIKTGFESRRKEETYANDNPGISPALARHLRGGFPHLRFLGMDFISVSRVPQRELGRETHRILLDPAPPGSPILPVEDMRLSPLSAGSRFLQVIIAPLRVVGADGAPALVIAEID